MVEFGQKKVFSVVDSRADFATLILRERRVIAIGPRNANLAATAVAKTTATTATTAAAGTAARAARDGIVVACVLGRRGFGRGGFGRGGRSGRARFAAFGGASALPLCNGVVATECVTSNVVRA